MRTQRALPPRARRNLAHHLAAELSANSTPAAAKAGDLFRRQGRAHDGVVIRAKIRLKHIFQMDTVIFSSSFIYGS